MWTTKYRKFVNKIFFHLYIRIKNIDMRWEIPPPWTHNSDFHNIVAKWAVQINLNDNSFHGNRQRNYHKVRLSLCFSMIYAWCRLWKALYFIKISQEKYNTCLMYKNHTASLKKRARIPIFTKISVWSSKVTKNFANFTNLRSEWREMRR